MREKLETLVQPVVAGLLALVTLIGLIGPAIKSPSPHDIPVGLVGPAPATQQIATAFATNAAGAFHFTTYGTETDARAAIDARDIDGALVLGSGGPHLIIAGAAGDGATGVITGAFSGVFQSQGQTIAVETVHPFASGDPHGLILFFVILAVLVSTLIAQALAGLRRGVSFAARLALVVVYAIVAAPVAMGVVMTLLGALVTPRGAAHDPDRYEPRARPDAGEDTCRRTVPIRKIRLREHDHPRHCRRRPRRSEASPSLFRVERRDLPGSDGLSLRPGAGHP